MKKYLFFLLCMSAFGHAWAQNFLKNSPFRNTFNANDVEAAINGLKDYYKVENGGVSFIQIIDSLPHQALSVYAYAAEYLAETYKITKYEVKLDNPEMRFIAGEGEFNSFASYAAYPNQYIFTCNPILRIDAKDGRARVCVSVKTYSQIRTNGNIREDKEVPVCDVSPINTANDASEKMYNKVFLALAEKALDVIEDFEDFIRSKLVEEIEDW